MKCAILSVIFLLLASGEAKPPSWQGKNLGRVDSASLPYRSKFRYVIAYNLIDPLGPNSTERRSIGVLMEPAAFTEDNLKLLFELVSKRFPDPTLMYVDVFTDLEDIATPEEQESPAMSELPSSQERIPRVQASFIRNGTNRLIRYWYTSPKGLVAGEINLRK